MQINVYKLNYNNELIHFRPKFICIYRRNVYLLSNFKCESLIHIFYMQKHILCTLSFMHAKMKNIHAKRTNFFTNKRKMAASGNRFKTFVDCNGAGSTHFTFKIKK